MVLLSGPLILQASRVPKVSNRWHPQYSGFLGPASVAYAQQQNDLLANGSYEITDGVEAPITLPLGTLGSNNGCIDVESQLSSFQTVMFNNTYGVKVLPDEDYDEISEITEECYGLVATCRAAAAELDPQGTGAVSEVNALCVNATTSCFLAMEEFYLGSNVSCNSSSITFYQQVESRTRLTWRPSLTFGIIEIRIRRHSSSTGRYPSYRPHGCFLQPAMGARGSRCAC